MNEVGPNNAKNRAHRVNRVGKNKLYIRVLKAVAVCKDCGSRENLTFDHLPGTEKLGNITDMVHTSTFTRLSEEVKKCEIVCWPCHIARENGRIMARRLDRLKRMWS